MTPAGIPSHDEVTPAGHPPPEDCERSRSESNEHDKSKDEHHGGPEDVLFRCFAIVNIESVYRHCIPLLVGGLQPSFLVWPPRQDSLLDREPSGSNPVCGAIRPTRRRRPWLDPTVERPLVTNCVVTSEHRESLYHRRGNWRSPLVYGTPGHVCCLGVLSGYRELSCRLSPVSPSAHHLRDRYDGCPTGIVCSLGCRLRYVRGRSDRGAVGTGALTGAVPGRQ